MGMRPGFLVFMTGRILLGWGLLGRALCGRAGRGGWRLALVQVSTMGGAGGAEAALAQGAAEGCTACDGQRLLSIQSPDDSFSNCRGLYQNKGCRCLKPCIPLTNLYPLL